MRIIPACELPKPILHYVFVNSGELCTGQLCELSRRSELAKVKLSGLYCRYFMQIRLTLLFNCKCPVLKCKDSFTYSDCNCERNCTVASRGNCNRKYGYQSHFCNCDCDDLRHHNTNSPTEIL